MFVCIQPDGEVMADTVGKAAPGVELKIADDSEVFYRSAGVFQEYFKIRKRPQKPNPKKDAWRLRRRNSPGKRTLDVIDLNKDVIKMKDGPCLRQNTWKTN